MKPILFYVYLLGTKRPIDAYTFFGFLAALYFSIFVYIHLRKEGIRRIKILLFSFFSIISFFVGARLLYSIIYLEKIMDHPYKLYQMKLVNFALYGGFGASFLTWYLLSLKYSLDFLRITDTLVPHLGISTAIVKLGCFFNGCCYGIPTKMPWGVIFENADKAPLAKVFGDNPFANFLFGSRSIPRHPTQVYEVLFALFAATIAFLLLRKKVKPGITSAMFLILYSVGRFISFLFRDFPEATFVSNIIRGPLVYGGVIIACILFLLKISRRSEVKI